MEKEENSNSIRSFVRRGTNRLSKTQRRALEEYGSLYLVSLPPENIDLQALFGNDNPIILEIGFGMGDASWQIAKANPTINYLCIDVHRPGIGQLIFYAHENKLKNIKVWEIDVWSMLPQLKENSLKGVHIFFPDPWPKKRHYKRRLVSQRLLDALQNKLCLEGYLYFVTDWENYAFSVLEEINMQNRKGNIWINHYKNGFADGINWRPSTSFEEKGKDKGHKIREIFIVYNSLKT